MKKELNFERFKRIIEDIQAFDKQNKRIDDFFEEEIMTETWCMITHGSSLQHNVINMLADEFDCWYSYKSEEGGEPEKFEWWSTSCHYGISNEIEWWLYESGKEKIIKIDKKEVDVTSIGSFYDYLMDNLISKKLI